METQTETSSDESTKPFEKPKLVCTVDGCSASFTKLRKLTIHMRRHTGEVFSH